MNSNYKSYLICKLLDWFICLNIQQKALRCLKRLFLWYIIDFPRFKNNGFLGIFFLLACKYTIFLQRAWGYVWIIYLHHFACFEGWLRTKYVFVNDTLRRKYIDNEDLNLLQFYLWYLWASKIQENSKDLYFIIYWKTDTTNIISLVHEKW